MAKNKVIKLNTFQSQILLPMEVRTAGTYQVSLLIQGNSLLSTVYVNSASGTVKANYFETTTGSKLGERKDLPSHSIISAASSDPSKVTVTPFHNKPELEVVVTGTVEFAVYATVVNSFATDLDAALKFDDVTFVPTVDKGLPAMCLDEASGKLFFLRCKDGAIITDPVNSGDPVYLEGSDITTPGVVQTLGALVVAAGKTQVLSGVNVSCFQPGIWTLEDGSGIIGFGRTSAGNPNSILEYSPRRTFAAGTTLTLKFKSRSGAPGLATDVYFQVMTSAI